MPLVFPSDPSPGQEYMGYSWDGEKWVCIGGFSGSSFLMNQIVFYSNGTYAPSSGMRYIIVEVIGGGGGGGNAGVSAPGLTETLYSGGGGGGGGYSRRLLSRSQIFPPVPVIIGEGGLPDPVAGGAVSGNGSETRFGDLVIARGGEGGDGMWNDNVDATWIGDAGEGATRWYEGIPFGSFVISGNSGSPGAYKYIAGYGSTRPIGGQGGAGPIGGGRAGPISSGAPNADDGAAGATNSGAGGSGATSKTSPNRGYGGAGARGVCVVTEYIIG